MMIGYGGMTCVMGDGWAGEEEVYHITITYPPTMAPIFVLMGVIGEGAEVGVVSMTMGVAATAAVGYPRHFNAFAKVIAPVDEARVAMTTVGRWLWVAMWIAAVACIVPLTDDVVTSIT